MKKYDYSTAINQLQLDKKTVLNPNIKYDLIPDWVQGKDFLNLFLPYIKIIGDSREQNRWIEKACIYYGLAFEWAKKDKKNETENLKEGDYSYQVIFGDKIYDYVGLCSYERKGSVSEFFGNCMNGRQRIKREFMRFNTKHYDKVVLMLQFGEKLTDLINMEYSYHNQFGEYIKVNTKYTMYSTILSWKQPNNNDFDIIQSSDKIKLFFMMLQDMYYYFRQEIRLECLDKNLIEEI
jgi:hypothetical protein